MPKKPQFGQFFDKFKVKHLQIEHFSEKWVSFKLKVISKYDLQIECIFDLEIFEGDI